MHNGPNTSALATKDGTNLVMIECPFGDLLTHFDNLPRTLKFSEGDKYRSDARLAYYGIARQAWPGRRRRYSVLLN